MTTLAELVCEAITDFRDVAALAHLHASLDITPEIAAKPHKAPACLPTGKMAVYAFFFNGQALKVGKVGPNSSARYTSQHYYPNSACSTVARSLLVNRTKLGITGIDHGSVGEWIRSHTDRVNFLVPQEVGLPTLSLFESFLHVRWKPVFEGCESN